MSNRQGRSSPRWRTWTGAAALACGVLACGGGALAQAPDRVITTEGATVGKVVAVSPAEVQVEVRTGDVRTIPVERIREVQFSGEPAELKAARAMFLRGRPAEALDELGRLDPADLEGADEQLMVEVEFVKAAAAARGVLGSGADPREAGRLVNEFLAKRAGSHHFYEMQELLGDLLARAGKPDLALAAYAQLAKGSPALQVRATAGRAKTRFEQEQYAEALREFDAALVTAAGDDSSLAQKRSVALGRARCLARLGRGDEAVAAVQQVITAADPDDKDLLARAFAALGTAYRAVPGREQDALISFLTVDLVYNATPESHAEALANLVELWEAAQHPERAREARQLLESSYPATRWAKAARGKG